MEATPQWGGGGGGGGGLRLHAGGEGMARLLGLMLGNRGGIDSACNSEGVHFFYSGLGFRVARVQFAQV